MIISSVPRPLRAWWSLILSIVVLVVWDVAVTGLYFSRGMPFEGINIQFSLFGSAIALFIGFMVNAAYGRWWEARTLWGAVVNSSRSLARQVLVLIDDPDAAARIVRAQVAYVHVLRTALRGQDLPPEAWEYLTGDTLEEVRRATNRQTALLVASDRAITQAARRGSLGEFARIQLEATLVALTDAQGGLERIQNTPLPVQYRVLPRLFARTFCLILPFAVVSDLGWATPVGSGLISLMFLLAVKVGEDLATPFVDGVHDIPMRAICHGIEVDLTQMLGEHPSWQVTDVDQALG